MYEKHISKYQFYSKLLVPTKYFGKLIAIKIFGGYLQIFLDYSLLIISQTLGYFDIAKWRTGIHCYESF